MTSSKSSRRAILWTPRVLCMAFAVFLSVFAFDAFEGSASPVQKMGALLIHLIPTFGILLVLWITWRRQWVGAILFPVLAIVYLVWSWGRFDWRAYAFISGPLVVMGVLFWLSWQSRNGTTHSGPTPGVAS